LSATGGQTKSAKLAPSVALQTWGFGETVRLPHPFGFEISTEHWDHWDD
jgi:hypothetical protein